MSELPNGWTRELLEELIQPRSERVSPADRPNAPYIGLEHVQAHTNAILGTVPASNMSSSSASFEVGDVLYGRMRPYLNKVARPKFAGLASAEFIIFPESEVFDSGFLLNRISSYDFVEFACSQYEGDRPRVKFDALGKFAIDLPPRAEQTRIVAKLEELLTDLDAGMDELKAAQNKLKQYRQSLLKSAVEGTLTAEWRAQHTPTETGAQLLQRILTERRARWEAKQLAKFKEQGKAPPKDWKKKYPEPVKPDTTGLPVLPAEWVWASVEQIASDERYSLSIGPFGSNLKVPDYRDAGVPLVFVRNIRSGNYGGEYTKYVTREKALELSAHSVAAGDVLVTKMGDPPGDADVYPLDQVPAVITADCIKIRCWSGLMDPQLLKAIINSYIGQRQIGPMTQGVAQKKVSLGRFTSLAVPVPPTDEQSLIVRAVASAASEAVEQLAVIEHSLKQSTAQRQNILRAAFAGQLVPQDPNDEPASILLERIRAERANRDKQPKVRQTKQQKEIAAVVSKLINVLAEAGDWVPAQEAFRRCGVADGALTGQIEDLYAELRALDKAGRLAVEAVTDTQGRKLYDRLKLRTA